MTMRAFIPIMAAGLGVVGLSGCIDTNPYRASSYRPGPTTTTTTTVVRDAYGNPLSTAETVRDANGNPVNSASAGTYQNVPVYYQNAPGYSPQLYRRD
jgi:hypothetical protein